MERRDSTEQQLITENEELRRRIAALEAQVSQSQQAAEASELLQREAEERRRAEATLDAFFNASITILNIFDDESRCLKTDRLTPTYFGLDSKSIVGKSCKELVPRFIEEYGPMLRRVIETGEPVHNTEVKTPLPTRPGEMAYWRASYFPVTLPEGKRGYGVVGVEITDMKRTEEALRQSRDQLQLIYDEIIEGILLTDIATKRFVRVNSSMCRMLGYTEEKLLAASVNDIHPPEEVLNDLARFQTVAEGRVCLNQNRPVLRKDGTVFYADIMGHRIVYDGRPCVLALFRDVTERKRAQEALERERQSLWHMLQASDHERQIISYEIHDGLAQYLAAAGMQFQAHDALKEDSPEEAQTACHTAVELVRQAHCESRRLISEVRPPVIDEIGLETAISHLVHEQRLHGGPEIHFDSNLQFGRLPQILEDALYRIAQEAVTNACKHSKSKKAKVTLAQEAQELRMDV